MSNSTELKFHHEAGCLIVIGIGRYLLEHKEAAIKEIAAAIELRPTNAALIDLRGIQDPCSFMDRYNMGEFAARYLTALPVGCLCKEQQADPDRIGKVVANNRGTQVEVFTDEAQAYTWLKQYQQLE